MTACERCGKETIATTMSWFNTQMICTGGINDTDSCDAKERLHPRYSEARVAEQASLDRGERNFPGIGLPEELNEKLPTV